MSSQKTKYDKETFSRNNCKVEIRKQDERTEIVIDGTVHEVRFLQNGRPYTKAYVNAMAKSVRDLAEKFVDFSVAQQAHWDEIAAASETGDDCN